MATAFTPKERERIQRQLLDAALSLASQSRPLHVSVDELARMAGISKGAFYSFYDNKEMLFLDMVERIHREMYGNAAKVLASHADRPIEERVSLAISEVYRVARQRNVIAFIREEVPRILRKLPPEKEKELYRSDSDYIRDLISQSKAQLTTDIETACVTVRLLLMTLLFRNEVGGRYDDAVKTLIDGACQILVVKAAHPAAKEEALYG
ncbi:MAG: TetR/AcrR family transcriptional regulator [Eubacteriales bacterium]|nr:TetR/AcrR family transcriptional regulator [Eubacteriales bacterium]